MIVNGSHEQHNQQMFIEQDSPSPRNVNAVKLMSRTAAIYEVCASRPVGRQPELDGRK